MEPEYDPQQGSVGYLTWDQWDRLTRAWQTAHRNLPWWWVAGNIRSAQSDELKRRSSEHPLPLPATWLAAQEITRLMHELNRWPELEDAANDIDGSDLAMLLVREVETAAAKWPFSDRSHRVRYFRCQACDQMTLRYMPPNEGHRPDAPTATPKVRLRDGSFGEVTLLDVVVRCTDPTCGAVMDHTMFEHAVAVIWQERKEQDAKRRLDAGSGGGGDGGPVGEDDSGLGGVGSGEAVPSGEGLVVLRAGSDSGG